MKALGMSAALLAVFMFALSGLSRAQTVSPKEQALGQKLMQEINNGLTCGEQVVTLQRQVADLQEQVKKAKEAAAPKESKPEKK